MCHLLYRATIAPIYTTESQKSTETQKNFLTAFLCGSVSPLWFCGVAFLPFGLLALKLGPGGEGRALRGVAVAETGCAVNGDHQMPPPRVADLALETGDELAAADHGSVGRLPRRATCRRRSERTPLGDEPPQKRRRIHEFDADIIQEGRERPQIEPLNDPGDAAGTFDRPALPVAGAGRGEIPESPAVSPA